MKLASFEWSGEATYGVLTDAGVVAAGDAFRQRYPDLRAVLADQATPALANELSTAAYPVDEVRFLPPLPNPDKILCVGANYRPHIEEMGREIEDYPLVFVRFPGSIVGHDRPILRPRASDRFDFEGELAVVIGRRARHVSRDDALRYIAGYCCFMDGSVRDWQRHTAQFTPGKNFDSSGAMGPCIVTPEDIPNPATLQLTTRVNGDVMQQGRVRDLVFDIPGLIEYCSTFAELLPGDVIATGTPGGVGAARTPPRWLQPGDLVEVEIPGVGLLRSPVTDESPAR